MAEAATQRPAGAAEDWTIPQDWAAYTPDDHAMWDRLFARQAAMLPGRAVNEFVDGASKSVCIGMYINTG